MIDDETTKQVVGGTAGTLFLAWVVRGFIRIVSRDRVEGHKDRAEIDFITTLREENRIMRERVDMAFKERNAAMEETAKLRGEVALLRRDLEQLEAQLLAVKSRLGTIGRADD